MEFAAIEIVAFLLQLIEGFSHGLSNFDTLEPRKKL